MIHKPITWGSRSLSYTRPRCGWSWQTHWVVAVSRSIHLQRTPCRRRPQMSRCGDQGSHDTHRSSSPPAHCSLNSPEGLRWLLGDREKEERAILRGCYWMIFSNLFTLLWHFSLSNKETVIETAPEAEDRKRECDKLEGNPALTIVEVLIPALISGAVYSNTKQFSMFFSRPVTGRFPTSLCGSN